MIQVSLIELYSALWEDSFQAVAIEDASSGPCLIFVLLAKFSHMAFIAPSTVDSCKN